MRGRDQFRRYKPVINLMIYFYKLLPGKIRLALFAKQRKKTGGIALVKRYALLKTLAKSVGENVSIFPDVYLKNVQNLEIGNDVSFQPMVYIEAYGGVSIGNDVSFAEGASVFSVSHSFNDNEIAIKNQPLIPMPIAVSNNVWVGSKATILGGVNIEEGTIVAAGAVVNKSTEKYVTVGGVPARIIKKRG